MRETPSAHVQMAPFDPPLSERLAGETIQAGSQNWRIVQQMASQPHQHAEWARFGAKTRLAEIQAEMNAIYEAFPELRHSRPAAAESSVSGAATKKNRRFSAAGKNAISQGMRRYWARRKALAAKSAKAATK